MAQMTQTKKKGSFKRNVVLTILALSVLSIAVTGTISLEFVSIMGQMTIDESTEALRTQINRNIILAAQQNARVITQKLASAEALVNAMAEECIRVLSPNSTFAPRDVYYDYFFENPGPRPSDTHYDERYGINVSWNYSSWYAPGTTSSNYNTYQTANADRLGRISNLDFMFQAIHRQAPEFRWLYVAFAKDNLFINYPGSIVGGTDAERSLDPWYPTLDDWYTEIYSGGGNIVFVDPYYDPIDGVLLISIGKQIRHENGTVIGVIAGDITIEDVNEKILNFKILESGYAALVKRVIDPLPTPHAVVAVVAHPDTVPEDYEFGLPLLSDVEKNSNGQPALTAQQLDLLLSHGSGAFEYTKDGQEFLMAYVPVEQGDYMCIVVVPLSEALAAIPELQGRIQETTTHTITYIMLVVVIGILLGGSVAVTVSNQITRPLQYLMDLAIKHTTAMIQERPLGAADLQVGSEYISKDDEIGELARAFQGMLDTIREDK